MHFGICANSLLIITNTLTRGVLVMVLWMCECFHLVGKSKWITQISHTGLKIIQASLLRVSSLRMYIYWLYDGTLWTKCFELGRIFLFNKTEKFIRRRDCIIYPCVIELFYLKYLLRGLGGNYRPMDRTEKRKPPRKHSYYDRSPCLEQTKISINNATS